MRIRNLLYCMTLLGTSINSIATPDCEQDTILFTSDAKDKLGQPVRILEKINVDGSQREKLTSPDFVPERFWPGYRGTGPREIKFPRVSSVGKKIVFSNTHDIYTMDWTGENIVSISRFDREKYTPRWSSDGKQIAFVSDLDENCDIYLMNHDGSNLHNISWKLYSIEQTPAWSPDSKHIAFISNRNGKFELFVSDIEGYNQKSIVSLDGDIREPDWASNNKITFSLAKGNESNLYMVDPDGKNLRQLTHDQFWNGHVAWDSKGQRLAYASVRSGNSDIYVMDLASGQTRDITNTPDNNEYYPCWVPEQIVGEPLPVKIDNSEIVTAKLTMDGRTGKQPVRPQLAAISQLQLPRPRMLFHKSDIPEIKKRLEHEPYLTSWNLFLSRCDSFVKIDSQEYKKVLDSIQSIENDPLYKRYKNTAFRDMYNRAEWIDAVFSLAFAYQMTGDSKYGNSAVSLLLKAAEQHRRFYGVMQFDYRIACTYDWIYELIPEPERIALNTLLFVSIRQKLQICLYDSVGLMGAAFDGCANWSIYYAASLGPAALALFGEPGYEQNFLSAAERLSAVTLNNWINEQGECAEGFSYFADPIEKLMPFMITLKRNRLGDTVINSNLKNFPYWMVMSAGKGITETTSIGDCNALPLWVPSGLRDLYSEQENVEKVWNRISRGEHPKPNVCELLWWRPSAAKPQDFSTFPMAELFSNEGYAVLRTGFGTDDQLLTISAPPGGGHSHREYGAITLSAYGLNFLVDPGQSVSTADYHNQVLINGRGRSNNTVKFPMAKLLPRKQLGVIAQVNYQPAFNTLIDGHAGYSAIPIGGMSLQKGIRYAAMIHDRNNPSIPPYYLICDDVQVDEKTNQYEQLFLTDMGFSFVPSENNGTFSVTSALKDPYLLPEQEKGKAEFTFKTEQGGAFNLWIYTKECNVSIQKYAFQFNCWMNGKKFQLMYSVAPSRPDTWQWRQVYNGEKPFTVELGTGQHSISIESGDTALARVALTKELSEPGLFGQSPDVQLPTGSVMLLAEKAKLSGNGWKLEKQKQFELLVASLNQDASELNQRTKSYRTRFHGQELVILPQIGVKKNAVNPHFLTLLYAHTPDMEQPLILRDKNSGSNTPNATLKWKNGIDSIDTSNGLKVKRRYNDSSELEINASILQIKERND